MKTKRELPPALRENAERLKQGKPLKRADGSIAHPAPRFGGGKKK